MRQYFLLATLAPPALWQRCYAFLFVFALLLNASNANALVSPIYGGATGTPFTDNVAANQALTGVSLRAGWWVDSIQGLTNTTPLPKHGGNGGSAFSFTLGPNETLIRVYGSYGLYLSKISFVTNTGKTYGPYGLGLSYVNLFSSYNFDFTVPVGHEIVGFTGRAGQFVDAFGVVYRPAALTPTTLKGVLPPDVPGLLAPDSTRTDIITPVVTNKAAAIALGKALFWDQGIGSDNMACASCHFHAGADNRTRNQVNPGFNHANLLFNSTRSGAAKSGPNYQLKLSDFPFDPNNDDVVSSAGTFAGQFSKSGDRLVDTCNRSPDNTFNVGGVGTRLVEPRNTPTTINAAYNFRNFWDGRANNVFNGVSPFGLRDKGARVFISMNNSLVAKPLNLLHSSLASQAVGPVLSTLEMSCANRQFADVGRKILTRKPLAFQQVDPYDGVLGTLPALIGATGTYADLVKKAFNPTYWSVNCNGACGKPADGTASYSQMEANFSLYFGLAIQLYEATLLSDDSKFDRWQAGGVQLTAEEQVGWNVFNNKGNCVACHNGPVFTSAAIAVNARLDPRVQLLDRMLMKDGLPSIYDAGFYNLGVVPNNYDLGVGGVDPWNNPLSFAKQYQSRIFVDNFTVDACLFDLPFSPNCAASSNWNAERVAAEGSFKTPSLRNVELTGPYMHNGSLATLEQVVDFYNRGGNFENVGKHPAITPLGLTAAEKTGLIAFLKTLTDERVAFDRAPFDHPAITIPDGFFGDNTVINAGNVLDAKLGKERSLNIPAVGNTGNASRRPSFETVLSSEPSQGSFTAKLKSLKSGMCLGVEAASNTWLAKAVQQTCNATANNQKLIFSAVAGKANVYNLKFSHSNLCLDIFGGSLVAGTEAIQYGCHTGLNQQFRLTDLGGGLYSLTALHSNLVLDVYNASMAEGTKTIQWPYTGATNQQWLIELL